MIKDDDIFHLIQTLNVEGIDRLLDRALTDANYVIRILETTDNGLTPLMAAIHRLRAAANDGERVKARAIITLIFDACRAIAPAPLTIPDDRGVTPLGGAILLGEEDLCLNLLDAGVSLHAPCDRNYLPLEVAACEGWQNLVIKFIARNAPYSPDVLPPERARDFAIERRTMMVILYRALRQAPQAAHLVTAIFMNDGDAVIALAPLPQARRPLTGHSWSYILFQALPHYDQACALLIPYLCREYTVRDCLAIAIDKNAEATFTVSINSVISTIDLGMIDTYQLARLAFERGQIQRAIAVLRRYAEIVNAMTNETEDTFPDGTIVSPLTLAQVGIVDHSISPFLGEDQTEDEGGIIPNYFDFDQPDEEVLAILLEEAIGQNTDDLLNAIVDTIFDDDIGTASAAIENLLDNAVVDGDHDTLRRLLRVPLTPARLSGNLPDAFDNDDLEAVLLLFEAGADPTIDGDGEIIDINNNHTVVRLQTILPYTLLINALANPDNNAIPLRNALILLSFDVDTSFRLVDGNQITLIEVAAGSGNTLLTRALASLGMNPCPYFTSFLNIPHPTDIQINTLTTILDGLSECWNEISNYGFYACQLFVGAHMTPTGNQLIATLRLLAGCQHLDINIRQNINLLADAIAIIDIHEIESLSLRSLRVLPIEEQTENNFQMLTFPWNARPARDITLYIRLLYDGRNNMTPDELLQAIIRIRSLQFLGQNNNGHLLRILQILNGRLG